MENTWQLLLVLIGYDVPRLRTPCNSPFNSSTTSFNNPMWTESTVVKSSSDEDPSSPQPPLIKNIFKLSKYTTFYFRNYQLIFLPQIHFSICIYLEDGPPPWPESEEFRLCLRSCCLSWPQRVRSCCCAESISSFIWKINT